MAEVTEPNIHIDNYFTERELETAVCVLKSKASDRGGESPEVIKEAIKTMSVMKVLNNLLIDSRLPSEW